MLNEQESRALSTNPLYFQEMETNEPEGLYNFRKEDMFAEDEYCSPSIERDMFRYNFKECYDPIHDELAEGNEGYSPYTFLNFKDSVNNMHEEEEKASKDFNITSDLLFNETIENLDIVSCEDEDEKHEKMLDEGYHGNILKHSIFLSPLLEEQISQHYDKNNKDITLNDNCEVHKMCSMYSQCENPFSSSYEPKPYQIHENDIKSNKCSDESVLSLKHSSEIF